MELIWWLQVASKGLAFAGAAIGISKALKVSDLLITAGTINEVYKKINTQAVSTEAKQFAETIGKLHKEISKSAVKWTKTDSRRLKCSAWLLVISFLLDLLVAMCLP